MRNVDKRLARLEGDAEGDAEVVVAIGGDFDLPTREMLASYGIEPNRKLTIIRTNGAENIMAVAHCSLTELLRRIDGNTRDILQTARPS